MFVQVLNSSQVSGPESLVFESARLFPEPPRLIFLVEQRLGQPGRQAIEQAKARGLLVEAVEVSSRLDFRAIRDLRSVFQRLNPKIIHAHDVKATTYSWLAAPAGKFKIVSTHHGVEGRPDTKTRFYERFYSHLILPKMDAVIVVSAEDRQLLLSRGLASSKLHFVPNGITLKRWEGEQKIAERMRIREIWSGFLPEDRENLFLIGMIARMSQEKRHGYFLEVLANLKRHSQLPPWKAVLIGTGPLEGALREQAKELGLSSECVWLGYQKEAGALIPALDLVMLCSSAEGMPITALEAGWAGVPLFTSDVGALPGLLGGEAEAGGKTFPRQQAPEVTAEELANLLRAKEALKVMGQCLQHRVARDFSAESYVSRLEAVYRSI